MCIHVYVQTHVHIRSLDDYKLIQEVSEQIQSFHVAFLLIGAQTKIYCLSNVNNFEKN